jgi:phosphoribosylformimino-5-aminoimidazole carboxamide ribotide isomerase
MTKYVGCIDLHDGQVKQIVGATLTTNDKTLATNYVSPHSPEYYSELYKKNNVLGTHVIKLGSNDLNDKAAMDALSAWPGKLQVGGGISLDNCKEWIERGADKVIITSWLFPNGELSWERLKEVSKAVGKDHLVVDVSCKRVVNEKGDNQWVVAMNKWQTLTNTVLDKQLFNKLSKFTSEFLVHAADVEGLCKGIDEELVVKLGEWCSDLTDVKVVYAGGAKSFEDLKLVDSLSKGKVDLTYGSSLDIFGGSVKFTDLVSWNNKLF